MKAYRPSNGTEGVGFIEHFCENCIHEKFQHTQKHGDKACEILSNSMLYGIDEEKYPKEWCYIDNNPTCTSWVKWDWGNDEDGWNDPIEPIPDDPNQLCMPFGIWELLQDDNIVVTKYVITEREFA